MKNVQYFKQLPYLCLILTFVLVGCSNDDASTDDNDLAAQTAVENEKSTARRIPEEDESMYAKALKDQVVVRGDFKSDYKAALKALEKEDFDKARDLLTRAVAVNNIEQLKLRFTGMHFGTYFPHYHLGMIAFLNYDCTEAMKQWDISQRQGAIKKSSEYQYLQDGLLECQPEGA